MSRANNTIDGITGLLLATRGHYLQLLEGPPESVSAAYARIARDSRHDQIAVLTDTVDRERVFSDWSMASMPGDHPTYAVERLLSLLTGQPPDGAAVLKRSL